MCGCFKEKAKKVNKKSILHSAFRVCCCCVDCSTCIGKIWSETYISHSSAYSIIRMKKNNFFSHPDDKSSNSEIHYLFVAGWSAHQKPGICYRRPFVLPIRSFFLFPCLNIAVQASFITMVVSTAFFYFFKKKACCPFPCY